MSTCWAPTAAAGDMAGKRGYSHAPQPPPHSPIGPSRCQPLRQGSALGMDGCVDTHLDQLHLEDCGDEHSSLCASILSVDSDASNPEEHPQKARRYSGAFNDPTPRAPQPPPCEPSWTPDASDALYNIQGWGSGYFSISQNGHLLVKPQGGEFKGRCRRRRPPAFRVDTQGGLPASSWRPATAPSGQTVPHLQRRARRWTCSS